MTAFNSLDKTSVCCLSLRPSMNLRKSRHSSGQKRNTLCKDIKSSGRKGRELTKALAKSQKPTLDKSLKVKTSGMNLVTSTPISHAVKQRISRSSTKNNLDEISKLNSSNIISCAITSTPIQKTFRQCKPCEIRLTPFKNLRKRCSNVSKSDQILRSNRKSRNNKLPNSSLNSPIEALKESIRSDRNSIVLRCRNIPIIIPNDREMPHPLKPKYTRKICVTPQKHLRNSKKSMEKLTEPHNEELSKKKNKNIRKSQTSAEKLAHPMSSTSEDTSLMSDKSNEIFVRKNSLIESVSQTSRVSLLQSCDEADNFRSSKYNLRKSAAHQDNCHSEIKTRAKKKSLTYAEKLLSPIPNVNSASDKSNVASRKTKKAFDIEVSQNSQISLSESNKKTETSKSSRYSLRLQNQSSSKKVSDNEASSKSKLTSQDRNKMQKSLLEPCSKNTKKSSLERKQSPKKTLVNKSLSQPCMTLKSHHPEKKSSRKKQKLAEKVQHQNKKLTPFEKPSTSSKKQMSSKKSNDEFQSRCLSFSGDIPIDDLALANRYFEGRKVKSDGFKVPGKNTLKRKRCVIDAIQKADEDYEDDIFESRTFDQFKDLLMDTSDSERSYAISTPKFPCTPLVRHKTPKFKDCYSPTEYAISRKAAMEYIYRTKKRKNCQKPETPVIVEKKKLEFSEVMEDAQKLQKTIESLAEEESDNDSYFSFG